MQLQAHNQLTAVHLVGFNNLPKYIKPSVFLADLTLHIPDIKPKNIISMHVAINNNDNEKLNYMIGFNSVKIIKKLRDILGTGMVKLYKDEVQVVMPDLQTTSYCEYNMIVNDNVEMAKQPYKLTHKEETNALKVVEMLEEVCKEKIIHVNAICCTGLITFINISHSPLVLTLRNAADINGFELSESDTVALTGNVPSELLPQVDDNTPINDSATARLTTEQVVKSYGFKAIMEQYSKEQKDQSVNLIKDSFVKMKEVMFRSFKDVEEKLERKFDPIEAQLNLEHARYEDSINKLDVKVNEILEVQRAILEMVKKNEAQKKPQQQQSQRRQSQRQPPASSTAVNPPTCGITVASKSSTNEANWDLIDEELGVIKKI